MRTAARKMLPGTLQAACASRRVSSRDPQLTPMRALAPNRYKGRPHWGKLHPRTFLHPKCPVRPLYPKFDAMLRLQAKVDPEKVRA
jgi:hypothetical protein